ncbi:MAG: phosphoribosylaminoimidazolesuccinocarboxamide synthase [Candidatus Altiarchaeales archaeon]|nr:MAG: phosphoribosylaminoimidazolesuccinocarboxamide synthase [Candidatus Altiarchaeales archaeon]RLI94198.1 MAG: phosphoribosylaminoimidazolesuccinocarboxamide synthase [Candidatus Altiarchaeales archaeon]HDO82398.1 phosphoribosylaminoimidazolesuccinocarboxamide synthase [Candidatus Altiarchaeales archaeon]HEX55047.1 phosphoribosylaminoimidazolesuccinocarboxamide synthase [Candidatus Altiarchaeales archaeon]
MGVDVVLKTEIPELELFSRGKVRDIYKLNGNLLIVSTDRISAFDYVLPNGIPYKGIVLNKLSEYWFKFTEDIVENHMITTDIDEFPDELKKYSILMHRSMIVKRAKRIDIECIVRGYLVGSAWREYEKDGSVCGIKLPKGLVEAEKLPEPIFTPSIKSERGHDINITEEKAKSIAGDEILEEIKEKSIKIYEKASRHAESKGIIIADTKFEFGIYDNELILIDEILTPDSSRFWPREAYTPGRAQESLDKQFVRDYLEEINWNKKPPAPKLPESIVEETSRRYIEIYERLTGSKIP